MSHASQPLKWMLRFAVSLVAGLLTLSAFASDGRRPRFLTRGSKVKIAVERVEGSRGAVLTGVVCYEADQPLPGVTVTLRDELTQHQIVAVTDMNGAFTLASLAGRVYRVEATIIGFKPALMQHLELKEGEVTHARVFLRLDASHETTAIAVGPDPPADNTVSTTFRQDLVQNLPMH